MSVKRIAIVLLICCFALVGMMASAQASSHASIVVDYDASKGELPEGIAFDQLGNMYVSLPNSDNTTEIRRYTPTGEESVLLRTQDADGRQGVLGLATDTAGNLYAAVNSGLPPHHGVLRITPEGAVERLPGSEQIEFPNSLAFDARGNLYVTESHGPFDPATDTFAPGGIWRIPPGGSAEPWLRHETLNGVPDPLTAGPIGANGIVHFRGTLYVGNTTKHTVVRVPILSDGNPGTPTVVKQFEGPLAYVDGITADVHGNLYPLMIGRYQLVRLNPHTGDVTTLATADDGLHLPASAAFGTGKDNRKAVYVTNYAFAELLGIGDGPSIVRVEAGVPGWPLP